VRSKKRYRVLVGLSYPTGREARPGDVVEDLPARSISWLLAQGMIEEVSDEMIGGDEDGI
jgi:hypothetical protein